MRAAQRERHCRRPLHLAEINPLYTRQTSDHFCGSFYEDCLVTVGLSEQQSIAAADTYSEIERREEIRSSHINGHWCCFSPRALPARATCEKTHWRASQRIKI